MIYTLPITKAREELTRLVKNAKKQLSEYVITVNGSPAAVIISSAEYESWKETMDIMANNKLIKAIKKGEDDLKAGRVHDREEVKKELKLNVQDKTHHAS